MCLLAVDWPLLCRLVPVIAVWALVWPAGRRCLGLGGVRAVRGLQRRSDGRWSLEDGEGVHYVEPVGLPTRVGPLFWLEFRSEAGRWQLCLDAKIMEPLQLRTLQRMTREPPAT